MKKLFVYGVLWVVLLAGILPRHVFANNHLILVLGDSISSAYGMALEEGWVKLLEQKLDVEGLDFEVINASITGDTSASGNKRIGALLQRYQPKIVIIELGGNDGLQGLALSDLKQNLTDMIAQVRAADASVLLTGMKILPNYGPKYAEAFSRVYTDLAEEKNIELVPFILEGIGGNNELMQADSIHPNAQAQATILENVWPYLQKLF